MIFMTTKIIFRLFLAIFLGLAAINFFQNQLSYIDSLSVAALLILVMMLESKYKISPLVAFSFCMIFIPNVIGHFGGYSLASLNYHYDWLVHSIAPIFAVFSISAFLIDNKIVAKLISAVTVAVLIALSVGSIIEISEYWGFYFIGMGSGYLGFGTGDNSLNFGPWENSSVDMTLNLIGSLIGALVYWIYYSKIRRGQLTKLTKNDKKH